MKPLGANIGYTAGYRKADQLASTEVHNKDLLLECGHSIPG